MQVEKLLFAVLLSPAVGVTTALTHIESPIVAVVSVKKSNLKSRLGLTVPKLPMLYEYKNLSYPQL